MVRSGSAGGAEDAGIALGVEPILFGIIVTAWDLLFLGCNRAAKGAVILTKKIGKWIKSLFVRKDEKA